MALKNTNLQKVGGLLSSANGQASGHTQMQLVVPAAALPDPGPRSASDSTWPARNAAYIQSVQMTQKFGQDWE